MPLPLSEIEFSAPGVPPLLLVMFNTPDRAPPAVGVNTTWILQDCPAASDVVVEQLVLEMLKSPVVAMAVMLSGAPPVFDTETS
jgi:hypothetical protein